MNLVLTGIRAAIIDLDGTMVDTAPDFLVAINRMRADLALAPLDLETIKNFVGKGTENLIRRVLAVDYDDGVADQHFSAALASYHHHYHMMNGDYSTLYPNVHEGLTGLRDKGLRLACVTNKPLEFALPLLEKTGLQGYFEIVYGGDSFPNKKPHPQALLQVCSDFSLKPSEVLTIGDSCNDALAARAAGCWILTVPYGYNHGQDVQEIDSDGIVSTLLEAAHLITV